MIFNNFGPFLHNITPERCQNLVKKDKMTKIVENMLETVFELPGTFGGHFCEKSLTVCV